MRRWVQFGFGAAVCTALVNVVLLHCLGGCVVRSLLSGRRLSCSETSYGDNIGRKNFEGRLAFESIDVVYTRDRRVPKAARAARRRRRARGARRREPARSRRMSCPVL